MAKRFYTRAEIQSILSTNQLKAKVSYKDREDTTSPDNFIIYYPDRPTNLTTADDRIHMRKIAVTVVHFHKKKLDSISDLMADTFACVPLAGNSIKQSDTDYWGDYYEFECWTKGAW